MRERLDRQLPRAEEDVNERLVRLAEKKHPIIAAAVLLEQHLRQQDCITDEEFLEYMGRFDLSDRIREQMTEAVQTFRAERELISDQEVRIRKIAGFSPDQEVGPEDFGSVVYRGATREKQRGVVDVQRQGPFFVAICRNREDYLALCANNRMKLFARKPGPESSAQYHAAINLVYPWKLKEALIPVLVISDIDGSAEIERAIEHETQHYINAVILNGFELTERKHQWTTTEGERRIKDEVLAYIKEGNRQIVGKIDRGPSYQHAFKSIISREAVISSLQRLEQALGVLPDVFNTAEGRAFIVYYLTDAPIEGFANQVLGLKKYFEQLFQPFTVYDLPRLELPEQDVAWQAYRDRYNQLKIAALLNPKMDIEQELQKALDDYQEAIPRVYRDVS